MTTGRENFITPWMMKQNRRRPSKQREDYMDMRELSGKG